MKAPDNAHIPAQVALPAWQEGRILLNGDQMRQTGNLLEAIKFFQ